MEICVKYNKWGVGEGGAGGLEYPGGLENSEQGTSPLSLIKQTAFAQKNDKAEIQERYKVLFFSFMKISNAIVTCKQTFIEKYIHLVKNPYNHEKMKVI